MKYYAVKIGRMTGIFENWPDCQKQILGFSGAVYKSFPTREEAEAFLSGETTCEMTEDIDCVAYVDGSYDHSILAYSYGVVIFYNHEKYTFAKMNNDPALVGMRNVAGEIEASMKAMDFAAEHHCKHLQICYDYAGIENWCTGNWKANKMGTQAYYEHYLEKSKIMKISFKKIKSHSNHALNDEADLLAKKALGLA